MKRKFLFLLLAVFGAVAFCSCEEEVDERESDELLRLQAYMSIHYPDARPTESGLYVIIVQEGTGATPSNSDFLLFEYTGQNLDDYVFETTNKATAKLYDIYSPQIHYSAKYIQYNLSVPTIIKGLEEGFSHLKEGGVAKLIMPSKLAYGNTRHQGLLPYTSVIFDIKLNKVVAKPEEYEQQLIEEYISENYPDLVIEDALVDGIYILESTLSDGFEIELPDSIGHEDVVKLYYTGTFFDDWVFDTNVIKIAKENDIYDSNRDYTPISVTVDTSDTDGSSTHIKGFSLALKNLQTSTDAKIIIPSEFAYGKNGSSVINPYTPLIFDLKILTKTSLEDEGESVE
ncbi:MAG TPA: hypothetical protein DG754_03500 [Bacteroidales bacterium]|jgi:FKBP-type peptidyl-prolyl cis-trans isomerase|nr:hypothetical protein [Bacteroidales bacterium]